MTDRLSTKPVGYIGVYSDARELKDYCDLKDGVEAILCTTAIYATREEVAKWMSTGIDYEIVEVVLPPDRHYANSKR